LQVPPVDVIAYFADDRTRVYQLLQWLPVLELLADSHAVGIVTRDPEVTAVVRERTGVQVYEAVEFPELMALYESLDPGVVLYCNNSMSNFQSLLNGRSLHVHINHGESDKHSMLSNNAKAYDRVFVAGEAAVQRHLTGLMEFDPSKLVRIGRPQLDLSIEPLLAASQRRTILYAPTWEGDADYNDYTSIDVFGSAIARAVLAIPDVRLVYKPHPKVATSLTPAVRAGHEQILAIVVEAARRDPTAGHRAICQGDILAVFPGCDAMITDVSSVGLDWLYLQTDKPIFLTDRHDDDERLRTDVPVSRCADVVNPASLGELTELVAARLHHDEHRIARAAMRHHYFDDLGVGDSTARFLEEVGGLVRLRAQLTGVEARDTDERAETA
jgi:hypothetical protein